MSMAAVSSSQPQRFRDREIVFENGTKGENVEIASRNPVNYHQVISAPGDWPSSASCSSIPRRNISSA